MDCLLRVYELIEAEQAAQRIARTMEPPIVAKADMARAAAQSALQAAKPAKVVEGHRRQGRQDAA
jgi:hypothetical protein